MPEPWLDNSSDLAVGAPRTHALVVGVSQYDYLPAGRRTAADARTFGLRQARYLFSSNGAKTKHPHPQAVARAIVSARSGAELYFNYSTVYNEEWANATLAESYSYSPEYPRDDENGLDVAL
jgi:hypothetical protein